MNLKLNLTTKDSGISWYGCIPNNWLTHIKLDALSINKKGSFTNGPFGSDLLTSEIKEEGVPIIYIRDIRNGNYNRVSKAFVTPEKAKQLDVCKVNAGDILIAKVGDPPGVAALYPEKEPQAIITQDVIRIKIQKKIANNSFIVFLLNSVFGKAVIEQITVESTRSRISLGDFKRVTVFLPLLPEQIQIASYLDRKTTAIDKKIDLLEEKNKKYQELRKSLINETVCRGLNKNVKLVDSGVEWIGKIPEHWDVRRFKSFAKTIKGRNFDVSDVQFEDSLPLLNLEYLRNGSVAFDSFCYCADKAQKATVKDLIIIWDGAGVGEILRAKEGFISSTIAKIEFNKKIYSSDFFYFLRDNIDYKLKKIPTGMGIPHLNPYVLNNFPCPFPPIEEQLEITKCLNKKVTKIDQITINIKDQIRVLKELRKTLINDVVTGKLKVSE